LRRVAGGRFDDGKTQFGGRFLGDIDLDDRVDLACVVDHADAGRVWDDLLKELELGLDGGKVRSARHVDARPSDAFDQTGSDRTGYGGDESRRVLDHVRSRLSGGRGDGQDQVDAVGLKLPGNRLRGGHGALSALDVIDDIGPFDVTE